MWLLDANIDVHLIDVLTKLGIMCDTAANRGWTTLTNGELVAAAEESGFSCLLTRDKLFGASAALALKSFPQFAVIIVNLPQQPWQQYREKFTEAWTARPIKPIPGRLIQWP